MKTNGNTNTKAGKWVGHNGTTMNLTNVHAVLTPDDLMRVGRFRYGIYVGEQGKQSEHADHANQTLIEPEDRAAHSQVYWVEHDGQVQGTLRAQFGPFDSEVSKTLQLHRLPFDSNSQLILFTRMMVAADARRSDVTTTLFLASLSIALLKNIPAGVLTCAPRLVPLFETFGCLTYADSFQHPYAGLQVPMAVLGESDYMRARGSPLADWIQTHRPASVYTCRFLDCVADYKRQNSEETRRSPHTACRLVAAVL